MEKVNTNLVAREIVLFLKHLELVSKITNKENGDITNYCGFTFGKPAKGSYVLLEDGTINVDLDFSSDTWHWGSKKEKIDTDLDGIKANIDTWKWMNNNQEGFIRLLNIDMVDFEELKRILMEKYGIDFNVSYGERVFAETKVNGSEDRISSAVCIFNVIDSHMVINGNVKQLISEQGTKTL